MRTTDSITRAEISLAACDNPWHGRYFSADTGASFDVIAQTPVGPIVRGVRTGALGRVVRTGNRVDYSGQVRARIEFARDSGDAIGTLTFDGDRVGGRISKVIV